MTVVALTSAKHAPGVTTAALALASAWSVEDEVILVEADPAGGDVAARVGLGLEPGLVTLAASSRHAGSPLAPLDHVQPLPAGGQVVAGPPSPAQATTAIASLASRFVPALRANGHGIVDCGRWSSTSTVGPVVADADLVLLMLEPTVSGVEHARIRLDELAASSRLCALLLAGERPYLPDEVAAVLGVLVAGALPADPRGVAAVHGGPAGVARRTRLVRSARSVVDRVTALVAAREGVGV
ncbi:MAG: chromosome partitioning protein [Actinobacteria bacterium]|nr:chromosome partitioning protein [Actinomycetota bacterium]